MKSAVTFLYSMNFYCEKSSPTTKWATTVYIVCCCFITYTSSRSIWVYFFYIITVSWGVLVMHHILFKFLRFVFSFCTVAFYRSNGDYLSFDWIRSVDLKYKSSESISRIQLAKDSLYMLIDVNRRIHKYSIGNSVFDIFLSCIN